MASHEHYLPNPGFGWGYTPITRIGEPRADTGMSFGVLRLRPDESFAADASFETAALLLSGEVSFELGSRTESRARGSVFDEEPVALHCARGTTARLRARSEAELVLLQAENDAEFEPRLFDASSLLESELRDKGVLDDTSFRVVRAIFDRRNRPEAVLVLGEVLTLPGRWSSYPPHHHPQPEIYHYRFTRPQGYGHGELGDAVVKVRHGDTVKILDGNDHAQVAAPGYGMYYVWAIRHLPGAPYTGFEFTEGHRWLKEPHPEVWRLKGAGT